MIIYPHQLLRADDPGKLYRERIRKLQSQMLKQALDIDKESSLRIARRQGGKPWLPDYPSFHYNFTDSGDWIILAVSENDSEIGVDLQKVVPLHEDYMKMAYRFFNQKDVKTLEDSDQPRELFFRMWTVKEAYLKYTGEGLSGGMNRYPVDFRSNKIGGVPFRELPPPENGYFLTACCYEQVQPLSP